MNVCSGLQHPGLSRTPCLLCSCGGQCDGVWQHNGQLTATHSTLLLTEVPLEQVLGSPDHTHLSPAGGPPGPGLLRPHLLVSWASLGKSYLHTPICTLRDLWVS